MKTMSPRNRGLFGQATLHRVEVAVPRKLSAAILERIRRFDVPTPLVQHG